MNLNYIFEKPCGKSPCLALVLEPHDRIRKSILAAAKVNQSSTTRITLEERRRNLIAVKEKIQWVSLEQCDSTSHNRNTKLASELSVPFALGCFSIRPVQDLGKPHEYGYSRMKEPHEYGYSRVEEPHEYGYFRTKELLGYGYSIVKKLDGNIQDRHDFGYLVIVDKLLEV